MELLLFFICLIRIEEGVGVLVMLRDGEKYDDNVGKEDNYYCSIAVG